MNSWTNSGLRLKITVEKGQKAPDGPAGMGRISRRKKGLGLEAAGATQSITMNITAHSARSSKKRSVGGEMGKWAGVGVWRVTY